jgi:glycosyltransferase involved in cell wall biosynthesis
MTLQTKEIYKHEGRLLKRLLIRYLVNPFLLKPVEKKAILGAKRVIVASESIKTDICRNIPAANPDRIVTITNPVDLSAYQDSTVEELVVGVAAGDFTDNMDRGCLETLEQIVERLPEVEFIVTGHMSGEQYERMKKYPNLRALGSVDHHRYRRFLNEISVFLNPYLSFWDYGGSKFKLLEAAAAGLPVVSTTNGAIGFPDTDKLFIADSVTEFVRCIERLAEPSFRLSSGLALKSIVRDKHDHLKEACKLKELYAEILGES